MASGMSLALAAMLFYGLGDLVYKRAAMARVPAHRFLMVQAWCFTALVAAYGALTGTLRIGPALGWGALAGFFAFTGFYNFARSLQGGSVSLVAPIFRLNFVVTAALAVLLLAEPLTVPRGAGVLLAFAAVWLLLGGQVKSGPARLTGRALVRVLVATAAVGVANLLYKVGLGAGATPAALLVAQALAVSALSSGFAALLDGGIRPGRAAWRHAPLAAVVLVVAFVSLLLALERGEASVLVPVAQMGFVVTSVVGFVVLGEAFTTRKGLGLAAALAALASLAFAS